MCSDSTYQSSPHIYDLKLMFQQLRIILFETIDPTRAELKVIHHRFITLYLKNPNTYLSLQEYTSSVKNGRHHIRQ